MIRFWTLIVIVLASAATAAGQTPQPLLCDLSRVLHKPGEVTAKDNKKIPAGTVELVDGQFGKACKFTLVESTSPQLFTAWVNPTVDWNQFDGFSFWVKGDGSKNCGGLELIDGDDYGQRYGYCFPIQSKEWVKVTVPWSDVVPELSSAAGRCQGRLCPRPFPQRVGGQVVLLARLSGLFVHASSGWPWRNTSSATRPTTRPKSPACRGSWPSSRPASR